MKISELNNFQFVEQLEKLEFDKEKTDEKKFCRDKVVSGKAR